MSSFDDYEMEDKPMQADKTEYLDCINKVIHGDCLEFMPKIKPNSIDLVYCDPPFNIGYDLEEGGCEFKDSWDSMESYLVFMKWRVEKIYEVMKDSATFYLHSDYHASHYLKIMLDLVFGESNFIGEIVWKSSNGVNQKKGFVNTHDSILAYRKGKDFTFNKQYRNRTLLEIDRDFSNMDDDGRRYATINLVASTFQKMGGRNEFEWRGVKKAWLHTKEHLDDMWDKGMIIKTKNGYRKKKYLEGNEQVVITNLFIDGITMGRKEKSEFSYPTKKPYILLKRLISASSNAGDVVLDCFAGSGTSGIVAKDLNRNYICIDRSESAINVMRERGLDIYEI